MPVTVSSARACEGPPSVVSTHADTVPRDRVLWLDPVPQYLPVGYLHVDAPILGLPPERGGVCISAGNNCTIRSRPGEKRLILSVPGATIVGRWVETTS